MRRIGTLLAVIAMAALVAAALVIPAWATTVPTVVQAVNGGSGVHATTSGTITFTSTPANGSLIVIVLGATSCTSLTAPSGFTTLDAVTATNSTYYKVAGASESNAYQFSDGATTCFMNYVAYNITGENASSPIDAHGNVSGTGSTVSSPSESPSVNQPDLPIATFTTGNSATVTQNGTGWTLDASTNASTIAVYSSTQRGGTSGTGAVSDSITYSASVSWAASTILVAPASSNTIPSSNLLFGIGGPHVSASVTLPGAGFPALRDTIAWFDAASSANSFKNVSAANVATYCDWGVGSAVNIFSTPAAITNCSKSFMYSSIQDALPTNAGRDSDWPWGGGWSAAPGKTLGTTTANCPSVSSTFLKDQDSFNGGTIPDYTSNSGNNWFLTVNGGTIGSVASMGAGFNGNGSSTGFYYFYVNTSSATLRAYVQAVISNCMYGGSSGVATDTMSGSFSDNTFPGLQSKNGSIWDDYPLGKNFGTTSSGTYADPTFGSSGGLFSTTGFFTGGNCCHTRTSSLTGNDHAPATFPSDTSWRDSQASLLQSFTHADGVTPWLFLPNGGNNNDTSYITQTHVLGEVMEEYDGGCFGLCSANPSVVGPISAQTQSALGYPQSAWQIIDNLAMVYNDALLPNINPNAHTVTLTDLYDDAGAYPAGGANFQQGLRWHFFLPMIMQNDAFPTMWVSWINACSSTACTDTFGPDFTQFAGRYQAMPSDAYTLASGTTIPCGESTLDSSGARFNFTGLICDTAGARDTSIQCPGTSAGMMCAEFAHYYVEQVTGSAPCTAFTKANWTACAHDIGPALVIANSSRSNFILSAANLATWAPDIYSNISAGHLVSLCNPSGVFNWTHGATTYVYQYALPTTVGTAFSISSATSETVTPGSMAQIHTGDSLEVYGTAGKESVTVTATTGTTFTATFAKSHASTDSVQPSQPVCSGTSGEDFNSGGAPASGDAVYHTQTLSGVLNDTLTEGQAVVIVP